MPGILRHCSCTFRHRSRDRTKWWCWLPRPMRSHCLRQKGEQMSISLLTGCRDRQDALDKHVPCGALGTETALSATTRPDASARSAALLVGSTPSMVTNYPQRRPGQQFVTQPLRPDHTGVPRLQDGAREGRSTAHPLQRLPGPDALRGKACQSANIRWICSTNRRPIPDVHPVHRTPTNVQNQVAPASSRRSGGSAQVGFRAIFDVTTLKRRCPIRLAIIFPAGLSVVAT